jgi:hypothetical protein
MVNEELAGLEVVETLTLKKRRDLEPAKEELGVAVRVRCWEEHFQAAPTYGVCAFLLLAAVRAGLRSRTSV